MLSEPCATNSCAETMYLCMLPGWKQMSKATLPTLRSTALCNAMWTLVPVAVSMLGSTLGLSPGTSWKALAGQAVCAEPVSSNNQPIALRETSRGGRGRGRRAQSAHATRPTQSLTTEFRPATLGEANRCARRSLGLPRGSAPTDVELRLLIGRAARLTRGSRGRRWRRRTGCRESCRPCWQRPLSMFFAQVVRPSSFIFLRHRGCRCPNLPQ